MFKCIVAFALAASCQAASIETRLQTTLESTGSANVIVSMKGGNTQPLRTIQMETFVSRSSKLNTIASALKAHAVRSQASVMELLNIESVKYTSFWASNTIFIENASADLIDSISELEQVEEIHQEHIVTLEPIRENIAASNSSTSGIQWGIAKVEADRVWASGNRGEGIVVGTIDTGVRVSHEILRHNYVGASANGWYDPYKNTAEPNDGNGHGTHTMGTIVGSKGYGVAPGAKWLACKGCSTSQCTEAALLGCGQFILCPHDKDGNNEDCSKAPHVSSNSWGGGQNEEWYMSTVKAWRSADIIPVFAQGNSGPSCGSANSPGDYSNVIGVGASNSADALASFSSVGPSRAGLMKPDVSAPGENVASAWYNSDSAYKTISGTSMACPHTAGVITLMLASKKDNLTYDNLKGALSWSSNTNLKRANKNCGNVNDDTYPNNMFGHGVITALGAIDMIGKPYPTAPPTNPPPPPSDDCVYGIQLPDFKFVCMRKADCQFYCSEKCDGCY